jgi:hypothetical protein
VPLKSRHFALLSISATTQPSQSLALFLDHHQRRSRVPVMGFQLIAKILKESK